MKKMNILFILILSLSIIPYHIDRKDFTIEKTNNIFFDAPKLDQDNDRYVDPNLKNIYLNDEDLESKFDLILRYENNYDYKNIKKKLKETNDKIIDEIKEINAIRVLINNESMTEYEELNSIQIFNHLAFSTCEISNDPRVAFQWYLEKINITSAWNRTLGDSNVLVGIIDTGVDYLHEDLMQNYDPRGYDWYRNDSDPFDEVGHGTHVSGIIGAQINNMKGVAGIGNIKFFVEKAFGSESTTSDWYLAKGVIDAVNKGANITSNSWGREGYSELIHDAFKYSYSKGVINIVSAGNLDTDNPMYPAALNETISVAATTITDEKTYFSNYGSSIDLTAPGMDIYSTITDNRYGFKAGTSMSAPIVAGIMALMISQYGDFISNDNIKAIIPQIVDDIGSEGKDIYFGYGRINASKALNLQLPLSLNFINLTNNPIIRKNLTVFFEIQSDLIRPVNISLNLFQNQTLIDSLFDQTNTFDKIFSINFNTSEYPDGNDYFLVLQANNTLFEDVIVSPLYSIDNDQNQITDIIIHQPKQASVNIDYLYVNWTVVDIDNGPHLSNISIYRENILLESYSTWSNELKISTASYENASDYFLEIFTTDFYSSLGINSSNFEIISNPHPPELITFVPEFRYSNEIISGSIMIYYEIKDINFDNLNISLILNNSGIIYKIFSGFSEYSTTFVWNSTLVPDSNNYNFILIIDDGIYTVQYFSNLFNIDNPHIPLFSFNNDFPSYFVGYYNLTWSVSDLDNETVSGYIEYAFIGDLTTWYNVVDFINNGSYEWDTGKIETFNGSMITIRVYLTDTIQDRYIYYNPIIIITPYEPSINILSPVINNITFTNLIGIIDFSWESNDLNNDLLTYKLAFYDIDNEFWTVIYQGTNSKTEFNSSSYFGQYLARLYTSDGYFNISTDIGLIRLTKAQGPLISWFLPTNNSLLRDSINISWTIQDNDSGLFMIYLEYKLLTEDNWVTISKYSSDKLIETFFWETSLNTNLIIRLTISDYVFNQTKISDILSTNKNTFPITNFNSFNTTIIFETSNYNILALDKENDTTSVNFSIKEKTKSDWTHFSSQIINSGDNKEISLNWNNIKNGHYIFRVEIIDGFDSELVKYFEYEIFLAIPRILDVEVIRESNDNDKVNLHLLLSDPLELIIIGSYSVTNIQNENVFSSNVNIDQIKNRNIEINFHDLPDKEYMIFLNFESSKGHVLEFTIKINQNTKSTVNLPFFVILLALTILLPLKVNKKIK